MSNTIVLAFQSVAAAVGWTIVHSLWQITLIAVVLYLLLKWTHKSDATVRYALSIGALFLAVFWSVHTFQAAIPNDFLTANSSVSSDLEIIHLSDGLTENGKASLTTYWKMLGHKLSERIAPVMPFLAAFWLIGLLFFASRILTGLFQLKQYSTKGTQHLPSSWNSRLLYLKHISGIIRPIEVRLSQLVTTPITYRFWRPIILLPFSLYSHLSEEQIEILLLHELAHIKRQDYLVNLLQSGIEVMFFYHPFIWWMSKQARLEREHCCDDRVLNLRHNPMLYAQTLTQIQVQHFSLKNKLAMSATGNTGDFSNRIYRLFQQKEPYATLRNSIAAMLLLVFSAALMAFYPKSSSTVYRTNSLSHIQDTIPSEQRISTEASLLEHEKVASDLQKELMALEKALHENVKEEKNTTDKKVFSEADNDKKPLVIIDGKESKTAVENLDKDKIATMNVVKGKAALRKYGEAGKNGVIEIYTKGNEPAENPAKNDRKIKLNGATGTPNSATVKEGLVGTVDNLEKQPLMVVDGKKLPREANEKNALEDIAPEEIATISVLKGERALEKYGEEGANGVVEIITKQKENTQMTQLETLKIRQKELEAEMEAKKAMQKERMGQQEVLQKKEARMKANQEEMKVHQKELERKAALEKAILEEKKAYEKLLKRKEKEVKSNKASLSEEAVPSPASGLSVFPNPTSELTNIQLLLKQKGKVRVDIINLSGQVIATLVNETLDKGEHQFQWNADGQPAGSYFVQFNVDGTSVDKQAIIKK